MAGQLQLVEPLVTDGMMFVLFANSNLHALLMWQKKAIFLNLFIFVTSQGRAGHSFHSFSKHWASGPMLSISKNVQMCVCVFNCVCFTF